MHNVNGCKNGQVVLGDQAYNGKVILYIIKGQSLFYLALPLPRLLRLTILLS